MGAWIEICSCIVGLYTIKVAPLVGAWIEIDGSGKPLDKRFNVAPLVGAWIEITKKVRKRNE